MVDHRAAIADKPRGVPRVDDRGVLNGIFCWLRSGTPWAAYDLLQSFCSLAKFLGCGIFDAVSRAYDGDLPMIDSYSIRVHHHAANVKKGGRRQPPLGPRSSPCMGLERGGLTRKIDAVVDANGNAISLKLTRGAWANIKRTPRPPP